MAIYDLSSPDPQAYEEEPSSPPVEGKSKGRLFSAFGARLFFLILLVVDLLWLGLALSCLCISSLCILCTGGKIPSFKAFQCKKWIALRRSLVCAVSLLVALFSPSFGIMVACTYFLMYDKTGIEEVVPSSLQAQFKEFLPKSEISSV
jgi:hypothetical protein